jgi:hypothetical protein
MKFLLSVKFYEDNLVGECVPVRPLKVNERLEVDTETWYGHRHVQTYIFVKVLFKRNFIKTNINNIMQEFKLSW